MGKNCRVGYDSKYRFDSVLQPDQTCIRGIYDIDLSQLEIPRSHCMPILYPCRLTWSHMWGRNGTPFRRTEFTSGFK